MYKKLKFFLILKFILTLSIIFSKQNQHIDYNIGFKFNYSQNISIRNLKLNFEEEIKLFNGKYTIYIDINKIKDIQNNRKDINEDINKLYKREGYIIYFIPESYDNGSLKYYEYKNKVIGQTIFNIGYPEIAQLHSKILYFIKDEDLISIYLYYYDSYFKIPEKFPKYFNKETINLDGKEYLQDFTWKEPLPDNCKQFYNLIKTKSSKAPPELVKLEEYFDEIINSLELFDSKSVFYVPSVSNLRFRETPDLNGKFIRSLNQNEKLELLEKGKEETVNGVKGTWVKVKTEKGEVGWCFDAYLEEVKKK